ncbi:MAG: hypothetical protein Q8S29_04155 [Phreatobacter sp.]|nr:hypothetical protein [Phreatobacter sp.]
MFTSTLRRPAASQRQALYAAEALFRPMPVSAGPRLRSVPSAEGDRTDGCPACGTRHPIAPVRSRHLSARAIEHDWQCAACDHAWTTTTTLGAPSLAPGHSPRFAVGSSVRLIAKQGSRPIPSAPFVVVALRPSDSGGVQYRISCPVESFERVVRENELAPAVRRDGV